MANKDILALGTALAALIAEEFSNTDNIAKFAVDASNYGSDALIKQHYENGDAKEAFQATVISKKLTDVVISLIEIYITDKNQQIITKEKVIAALDANILALDQMLIDKGYETPESVAATKEHVNNKKEDELVAELLRSLLGPLN